MNNYPPNFNPNDLRGTTNDEEEDFEMHIEAGLADGGLNEDGTIDWIGEEEQWNRYYEIKNNLI